MNLHAVDDHPTGSVELAVACVAFEMLGLLVLDENLFVVKLTVAVPGG